MFTCFYGGNDDFGVGVRVFMGLLSLPKSQWMETLRILRISLFDLEPKVAVSWWARLGKWMLLRWLWLVDSGPS